MDRDTRRFADRSSDSLARDVLTELDDATEPLHVADLAERLLRREEAMIETGEWDRLLERKRITLHHDVLPRLSETGVVDYDTDANVVSRRGDVPVEVDWLDGDAFYRALAEFRTSRPPEEESVGVIPGRRGVIEYGRELADEAEDELFCMYVSTDLLEDECLRRAAAAIDRGVEMYLGSRTAEVRDLTREHLPDATLWEPQRDWLTAPSGYPKVGRLVLVDRRTVMLALLERPGSDGSSPEETALVGEGRDNPLVVLVRELLGPRLDHLDYQSANFQRQLHS